MPYLETLNGLLLPEIRRAIEAVETMSPILATPSIQTAENLICQTTAIQVDASWLSLMMCGLVP